MFILSREFTLAALERALKTAAQVALVSIVGTGAMESAQTNVFTVDWLAVLGFTLGGFVLSYLTSVASSRVGKWPGPSLTDEAVLFETTEDDEVVFRADS